MMKKSCLSSFLSPHVIHTHHFFSLQSPLCTSQLFLETGSVCYTHSFPLHSSSLLCVHISAPHTSSSFITIIDFCVLANPWCSRIVSLCYTQLCHFLSIPLLCSSRLSKSFVRCQVSTPYVASSSIKNSSAATPISTWQRAITTLSLVFLEAHQSPVHGDQEGERCRAANLTCITLMNMT